MKLNDQVIKDFYHFSQTVPYGLNSIMDFLKISGLDFDETKHTLKILSKAGIEDLESINAFLKLYPIKQS